MEFIPVLNEVLVRQVAELAQEIWVVHYTPIIGEGQVRYMLERFQSAGAIQSQIMAGMQYYLLRHPDESLAGYLAVIPRDGTLFLSKLYITLTHRGQGLGRQAVAFVRELARQQGLNPIVLTVNKRNAQSIAAYEKMGFVKTQSVKTDIGAGFFMDDDQMEMHV